jgi:hypothetical protein
MSKTEYILVNNVFRDSGSTSLSDFLINIESSIFYNDDSSKPFEISAMEIKYTNTLYNVYGVNDHIVWYVDDGSPTFLVYHVKLEHGRYPFDQLRALLENAFNIEDPAHTYTVNETTALSEVFKITIDIDEMAIPSQSLLENDLIFSQYAFQNKQFFTMIGFRQNNFFDGTNPATTFFDDTEEDFVVYPLQRFDPIYNIQQIYLQTDITKNAQIVSSRRYLNKVLQAIPNFDKYKKLIPTSYENENNVIPTDNLGSIRRVTIYDSDVIIFDPINQKFIRSASPYYRSVRFYLTDIYNYPIEGIQEFEFVLAVRLSQDT